MTHRLVEILTAIAVVLLGWSAYTRMLALAALAAAVVLRLAGTTIRRLLSAVLLVLGVAAVFVARGVPPSIGGVFLVAAGVLGLTTAGRWRRPTTRYERDRGATMDDQWKAIDAGEDPTI